MSTPVHTLAERLTAVRGAVSSESLSALHARYSALPAPVNGSGSAEYLREAAARVQVREAIAAHHLCSPALHRQLASDSSRHVRAVVASVASDGVVLNLLATDRESQVRERVCYNLSTPQYLVRVLSEDEDPMVRLAAESQLEAPAFETGSITHIPHYGERRVYEGVGVRELQLAA